MLDRLIAGGVALILAVGLSKLLERYRERTAFRLRMLEGNKISEPSH